MVRLTMTPAIVAAVRQYRATIPGEDVDQEPSLKDPQVGNAISHAQLIDIAKHLREYARGERGIQSNDEISQGSVSYHLSDLLRGSQIYIIPPKPRPEPV